jgi:hypothetical protein
MSRDPLQGKSGDVYREWNERDPDKVSVVKVDLPPDGIVGAIGKGVMIAYRSNKWQKDKSTTEDYQHDHDKNSPPTIYHESGEGRIKSVDSMLKNDEIIDLGHCIELVGEGPDGEVLEFKISESKKARLVCTNDKKTLIILQSGGPIFITGGVMKVTARGIEG